MGSPNLDGEGVSDPVQFDIRGVFADGFDGIADRFANIISQGACDEQLITPADLPLNAAASTKIDQEMWPPTRYRIFRRGRSRYLAPTAVEEHDWLARNDVREALAVGRALHAVRLQYSLDWLPFSIGGDQDDNSSALYNEMPF